MQKIIIVGSSSGIGRALALYYLQNSDAVLGLAARREDELLKIAEQYPSRVSTQRLDVTDKLAGSELASLIKKLGGLDLYVHCAGIGMQNPKLKLNPELEIAATNVEGFMRLVNFAFHYFEDQGQGHIAVISSIAGVKGLGAAPAYSASKSFENTYLEALEQLIHLRNLKIDITDIRPGFVNTPLLSDGRHYPCMLSPEKTARIMAQAIARRQSVRIIDFKYRLLVFLWRLLPRFIWVRLPIKN